MLLRNFFEEWQNTSVLLILKLLKPEMYRNMANRRKERNQRCCTAVKV